MNIIIVLIRNLIELGLNYGKEFFSLLSKEFIVQTLLSWILWKVLDFLWKKLTE